MSDLIDVGSVRVAFIGESRHTAARRKAVIASEVAGGASRDVPPGGSVGSGTACFVSLPSAQAGPEALRLLRHGCHVFLDAPQALSVLDIQQLDRTADEAGVHVGVCRPLRYAAGLAGLSGRATVAVVENQFGDEPDAWMRGLTETLDLSMHLCGTSAARRVEASSGRRDGVWPVFGVFSIRFDNGALAVASLRTTSGGPGAIRCILSKGTDVQEKEFALSPEALHAETDDFLSHVAAGSRPPSSTSDALAVARLLDHVLALLR